MYVSGVFPKINLLATLAVVYIAAYPLTLFEQWWVTFLHKQISFRPAAFASPGGGSGKAGLGDIPLKLGQGSKDVEDELSA
jgi:hypothetical protein